MVKNTLNIGRISEGFVLDHIQAGKSMDIYNICVSTSWTAVSRLSRTQKAQDGEEGHHQD